MTPSPIIGPFRELKIRLFDRYGFVANHDEGECSVCTHDPFDRLNIPEEDISEKQRQIRDEIWQEMSSLLADRSGETMLLHLQARTNNS